MMNTKTGKLIVFLIAGAALLLLPILLQSTGSNSWVRILDIALLYVLLALGLNIVVGYAGLLDLGYIAFFAVGAYVFALLGSPHLTDTFPAIKAMFPEGIHYSIWLVMIVAAVIAGIVLLAAFRTVFGSMRHRDQAHPILSRQRQHGWQPQAHHQCQGRDLKHAGHRTGLANLSHVNLIKIIEEHHAGWIPLTVCTTSLQTNDNRHNTHQHLIHIKRYNHFRSEPPHQCGRCDRGSTKTADRAYRQDW